MKHQQTTPMMCRPNAVVIAQIVFTADNKLTDEAHLACQVCGVEPSDILPTRQ